MNYKEKLEEFIGNINGLIRDDMVFPERLGGQFVLKLEDLSCKLSFKEGEDELVLFSKTTGVGGDDFVRICYWSIFRQLLFSLDYIPNPEKETVNGDPVYMTLSLQTLGYSGLKKIREYKQQLKNK